MPNWTKEQKDAIDKEGMNIIVSAGAGSGKTLVLTARVIRKLEDGVGINNLLVLTFTNEAAKEMKNRIRKAIKKVPSLKKELDLLDSSYITTFDSYSLSLVKKYNYLLNVSKNIKIVDSSIMKIKNKEFLDQIFEDLYKEENEDFLSLINDFCVKDDVGIKNSVLKLNEALEMKYDKNDYLNNYINNFYSEEFISKVINEYLSLIYDKFDKIKELYREALRVESDKGIGKYKESYEVLVNSQNYSEIRNNLKVEHPKYITNTEIRDEIKTLVLDLQKLTIYKDELYLKSSYKETIKYVRAIINIINRLDDKNKKYKDENNSYEFIDISKMAIKLVLENDDIRNEIKNSYNEIMVDEYQDTNDLQEMFISAISNNNVYMVGDIKQSIYRFRNSNPDIFKNKYDEYSKNNGGIKVDLVNNFRSREEVLYDINKIFNIIMDDAFGGADYEKEHQMIFGQKNYITNKDDNFSNYLDIYTYDVNENKDFSRAEKEAFIIAKDIKEKIKNKYKVIDKDTEVFRDIEYKDFSIIIDRVTDFDLYRQIFEYENIPLVPIKDELLTNSYDVFIIKNLINLIIKIKDFKLDQEFRYYFTSVARSYLFEMTDSEIFEVFKNDSFKDSIIFLKAKKIALCLDSLSCHSFLDMILKEFNFYEKCLSYRDIDKLLVRVSYLDKMTKDLENLGYTPYDLSDYITEMIESDDEIKYSVNTDGVGVSILTIHKSKGLEYPVCYYAGLYKKFNIKDIDSRFLYNKKYGIITPYYEEGIGTLFTKVLAKKDYLKDEISEKIRLFYVALTRAREKMIIVMPDEGSIVLRENIKSFLDLMNPLIEGYTPVKKDLDGILTKDYTLYEKKDLSFLKDNSLIVNEKEIEVKNEVLESNHFSKINNELKSEEELKNMKYGTDIHYLFETTDLKADTDIPEVNRFLKHDEVKNIKDANIYKEYEFMYEENNKTYHGIIDLMLVYNDHVDIIDYKLSNIDDKNYDKQLKGYRNYISNIIDLPINTYLYSISNDVFRKVE